MSSTLIPCAVQSADRGGRPVKLENLPVEKRAKLASEILDIVAALWEGPQPNNPRPMVFIFGDNGEVRLQPPGETGAEDAQGEDAQGEDAQGEDVQGSEALGRYDPFFWIPDSCLGNIEEKDKARQREMFAVGTLVFLILNGGKQWLQNGSPVTAQEKAEYPRSILELQKPEYIRILSLWSPDFAICLAQEVSKRAKKKAMGKIAKKVATSFAITGGVITGTILLSPILLPAIGFGAVGVGAGTIAAGWQSAIGAVEAGSLFAILQSAGAGGIAGIAALATTGAGAALTAGASAIASKALADFVESQGIEEEEIWRLFKENVRRKRQEVGIVAL